MKHLEVVILAAGKGSRMRSSKPKALFELAGKPLIFHVIDCAMELEPDNITIVIGHQAEAVKARVDSEYLNVGYVVQEEQKGTGHALLQTLNHLPEQGRLLVLYADVPLISIDSLNSIMEGSSQSLQWLSVEKNDPSGYGRILRDNHHNPIAIVEEKDAGRNQRNIREVNTGIFTMPITYLRHWLPKLNNHNSAGEYLLTDIMAMAHQSGLQIIVNKLPQTKELETQGVNNLAELNTLETHWNLQKALRLSNEYGVYFSNYTTTSIRGEVRAQEDVFIDSGCIFDGEVTLGKGVTVGPNCFLKNCQIAANTTIEAFCHIEGARVGQECNVGPYARLRPGSVLANRVNVGNFVEVKNANLGDGSKVNHLSYIGDAEVGREVNVGAGTITCNYDGKQKLQTTIKDQAFIGSNSSLVAPVTIGVGAYVGAGSTITEDIPDSKLSIARGRQVVMDKERPT